MPIKDLIHTIMVDNEKEFAKYQEIAKDLQIFLSIFVSHSIPGNVDPMKARTDSSGNTFPKKRISVK